MKCKVESCPTSKAGKYGSHLCHGCKVWEEVKKSGSVDYLKDLMGLGG